MADMGKVDRPGKSAASQVIELRRTYEYLELARNNNKAEQCRSRMWLWAEPHSHKLGTCNPAATWQLFGTYHWAADMR